MLKDELDSLGLGAVLLLVVTIAGTIVFGLWKVFVIIWAIRFGIILAPLWAIIIAWITGTIVKAID